MNILIVKMSSIGDVIHTLPALNALRHRFPDAHITWLVEESASAVVRGHEALDRVIVLQRLDRTGGSRGLFRPGNLGAVFRFIETLRDTRYDMVIDFQGLMKSAVMVWLSRGARKIGYSRTREWSYLALNERVPAYDMDKHAIFRYLNLVKRVGAEAEAVHFGIPFDERDKGRATSSLRRIGWAGQPVVAVNPMARWKTKLWPAENFSVLVDRLAEEHECFFVFTGAGSDRKEVARILSNMRRPQGDLTGQTDLRELAALYEMSRCVITTDTGPMHLAAAVGTPVVALFGATAPWRTGPFGEGHEIVRSDLPCSPCFKKKCDTVGCMNDVSPEQVFDAVTRVLARP